MVSGMILCFLFSYNLSFVLDPLVVWKSFKKERRHAERTWRYNTTVGCPRCWCSSFTPIFNASPAACSTVCLYVLDCLVTLCAWWPACTRNGCFLIWLHYLLSCPSVHWRLPLSISLHLCPVFPPLCAITCTSFFQFVCLPPYFFPPPLILSFSISHVGFHTFCE